MTSGRDNPDGSRVERQNRSIMEIVRSVLHSSDLPVQFWSEAVRYAVHVLNQTCLTDNVALPFVFYGHSASIKRCCTFGSSCWVHVQKER